MELDRRYYRDNIVIKILHNPRINFEMNNYLSASNGEVYSLKNIFGICSFFGIFPLEVNPLARYIHLFFYLLLNSTGIICFPFHIINLTGIFKMKLQEILMFSVSPVLLNLFIIICTYGLIMKQKSWRIFFKTIDNLNTEFLTNVKLVHYKFVLYSVTLITIFVNMYVLWKKQVHEATFIYIMTNYIWVSTYIQILGVTLIIWISSNILTANYLKLCKFVQVTFYLRRVDCSIFAGKLLNIQGNICLLHQIVNQINNLMGKLFFIVLALTFSNLLSFFDFIIFLVQSNKIYDLFGVSIIGVIFQLELLVSI